MYVSCKFQYDSSQCQVLLIFLIINFFINVISYVSFVLGPCFILISTFPSFLGL